MQFIIKWLKINKLCLNAGKTKFMIFDSEKNEDLINITMDDFSTLTIKEEKVRIKKY